MARKTKAVKKNGVNKMTYEAVYGSFDLIRQDYLKASKEQTEYDYNRGIRKLKQLRKRGIRLNILAMRRNLRINDGKKFEQTKALEKEVVNNVWLVSDIEDLMNEFASA